MESNREISLNNNAQEFIEENNANIYSLPKPRQNAKGTVLIGDLHGNSIKLLYFLIREGILELDVDPAKYPESLRNKITGKSKDLYKELVKIYEKDPDINNNSIAGILDKIDSYTDKVFNVKESYFKAFAPQLEKEDLDFFNAVISNLKITNKNRNIKLIGDEFCDRGNNDSFTLKIIEKLKKEAVPYEILFSNHGAEFYSVIRDLFDSYATQQYIQNSLKFQQVTRMVFALSTLVPTNDSSQSLQNLGALIKQHLISDTEVKNIVNTCCIPHLKLLSYIETEDGRLGICSHAPIGTETIQGLAEAFGIKCNSDLLNPRNLKETIDQINQQFQTLLNSNFNLKFMLEVIAKIDNDMSHTESIKLLESLTLSPNIFEETSKIFEEKGINAAKLFFYLHQVTWNRNRNNLTRPDTKDIFWINGHDKNTSEKQFNEICLDNDCGKNQSYRYKLNFLFEEIETELKSDTYWIQFIKLESALNALSEYSYSKIREISQPFLLENSITNELKGQIYLLLVSLTSKPESIKKEQIDLLTKLAYSKMVGLANAIVSGELWSDRFDRCDQGSYTVLHINEKVPDLKLEGKPLFDSKNTVSQFSDLWSKRSSNSSEEEAVANKRLRSVV